MRLYKVKSLTSLTIEIKHLFRKNKTYDCWYTSKTKFIYAASKEEAEQKYKELFFTPLESGEWNKYLLELHRYSSDDMSDNMRFSLPFNYSIKTITESVFVFDEPVNDKFDYIKHNSTGEDFKNWWHDYYPESNDPDWDCK